jgi:transposase
LQFTGFEAEKIIPANDSVRLLDEISEELDYRNLFRAYSHIGRKPATNPVTLFKILVYGGMDGKHSSRELERACTRDINYMWLLGDEKAPNHSEIARFRSLRLSDCCEDLFYQLAKKLYECDEIKYEHLFVDGTKIEANVNKYSFIWKKSTNKYQERLDLIEWTKS